MPKFTFKLWILSSCELVKATGWACREMSSPSSLSCYPNRLHTGRMTWQRGVFPHRVPTKASLFCFSGESLRPSACSLGRRMSWVTLATLLGWWPQRVTTGLGSWDFLESSFSFNISQRWCRLPFPGSSQSDCSKPHWSPVFPRAHGVACQLPFRELSPPWLPLCIVHPGDTFATSREHQLLSYSCNLAQDVSSV